MPPNELFITCTPALISAGFRVCAKKSASAAVTLLPWPEQSSVGSVSLMMRAATSLAPGAMPAGNWSNAAPAAISDTQVPSPTSASREDQARGGYGKGGEGRVD